MQDTVPEKHPSISNDDEESTAKSNINPKPLIGKKKIREKNISEDDYEIKNMDKWKGKTISNRDRGIHSKFKEDNMILKIKSCLFNSILFLLNSSFIYNYQNDSFIEPFKKIRFLKVGSDNNSVISKNKNLNLLKTKIRELVNKKISNKYKNIKENSNMELIEKIDKENKETNVINILDLTYEDFLNIFRGTVNDKLEQKMNGIQNIKEKFFNMQNFLDKTKEQEIKKGESEVKIECYIKKLEDLCNNFENWFQIKKGRNRQKKIGNDG